MNKNVQTFIGCDAEYAEANIVLCGIPFDGTTSYRPGARFGPSAMRGESYGIETYSPYVERDLQDIQVFDAGDLELPFGDTNKALCMTQERVAAFLADGKTPFLLGGEHLIEDRHRLEVRQRRDPRLGVADFEVVKCADDAGHELADGLDLSHDRPPSVRIRSQRTKPSNCRTRLRRASSGPA